MRTSMKEGELMTARATNSSRIMLTAEPVYSAQPPTPPHPKEEKFPPCQGFRQCLRSITTRSTPQSYLPTLHPGSYMHDATCQL